MRFFKRKDKRKNSGGTSSHGLPGFGGGLGFGKKNVGREYDDRNGGWPSHESDPSASYGQFQPMATRRSAAVLARLPTSVLKRIFGFVCPHSGDETYDTCEESALEEGCMLCDLRDLARCAQVSKQWKSVAKTLLYHSIRIDSVHYCEREAILAERRKRTSFFDRNGDPEDTARARLKLLCRTLREDPTRLGSLVEFFKIPYMLRESDQADLARTIAVLPNLKYVDLPEGVYQDDASCLTLRLEVQARCRQLRKMKYVGNAERSLQGLAGGDVWPNLEVLELIRLDVDPALLRHVLGRLENLRALKITDNNVISDEVLGFSETLPPFPPLEEFILTNVPGVSHQGLMYWLESEQARKTLKVLTLNSTGVKAWALQALMVYTPALHHLSIVDTVTAAIQTSAGVNYIPPVASNSLQTLHYEITSAPSVSKFAGVTTTYYNYLATSLLQGGLPNLTALYVREPNFPDMLLGLPPPAPAFAEGGVRRPASSSSSGGAFSNRFSSSSMSPGYPPTSPHGFLSSSGTAAPQGFPVAPQPFPPTNFATLQAASLPAPSDAWPSAGHNSRFSSNNPFASVASQSTGSSSAHTMGGGGIANLPALLEVFTKGDDELNWSFVKVPPNTFPTARRGSASRPLSSYGLKADALGGNAAGWSSGGGARRSVFVGGEGGSFLAVPDEGSRGRVAKDTGGGQDLWPRPISSAGEKRRERMDLWR